jgi:hypothetical protein
MEPDRLVRGFARQFERAGFEIFLNDRSARIDGRPPLC